MKKGWFGNKQKHMLASKGIKSKTPLISFKTKETKEVKEKCDVPNPMNTKSDKELKFGHFLTHTKAYQKSVEWKNAKCEHDRLVPIMLERGINHKSKFKRLI